MKVVVASAVKRVPSRNPLASWRRLLYNVIS
jgi:hypothetical protein